MDKNYHSGMSMAIKSRHKSINHASSRELAGPRRCFWKDSVFFTFINHIKIPKWNFRPSLIPVWRAHVCFYSTCAHKERKIFVSLRALTVRKFCSVTLWRLKGVMSRHLVTKSGFCRGLPKSKREESHLIHVTNGRRNVSSLLFAGTLGRLK